MKKMDQNPTRGRYDWLRKLFKIMKLTFFLVLFSTMLVSAGAYSQNTKLSLNYKNISIAQLLQLIEEQTEYRFAYSRSRLNPEETITIDVKNETLDQIMKTILDKDQLSYKIIDRYVVISDNSSSGENNFQQQKNITGKVTDSSGGALPGVSIVVKGTTTGTITDDNGSFSLQVTTDAKTLMFSFVGMKSQEITISGKNSVNVVMEEDAIGLEEVVAVGYGTARRKDLTGSVSSVSGTTLKDIPVSSAAQAMVGRMAGVQVTKTEGSPDAEIKIRVRGGGSITQDNSPLYIVDGFPVDKIDDVAPTDIESIDILKDASSTAIYGARGANGVILITTKSGVVGKGKISYNTYYGVKGITKTLDVLNPYEYVYWQHELQSGLPQFERYFGDFGDFGLYKQMKGVDWQDEVFGRTGTTGYHNLTFTGGSKDSKYNVSLTRNDEKEIMIGSGYSRTNLTIKTFHKINNWLTVDLNTRLADSELQGAGTSSNFRLSHAVQYRPVNGLMDFVDYELTTEDYEAASAYILNPVQQTNDDYRRSKNLTFNFNGAAIIKFSKDLTYRFEFGTQYGEKTNKRFYGIHTSDVINYGGQPIASVEKSDSKSYRLANTLTYTKKDFLPGNNLSVMVGEELSSYRYDLTQSLARYFPKYIDAISALSMMQLGVADPITTNDYPANKISSFFGRANYDYRGKYLASATLRADGSSKFAPQSQWGYFPSAALAWRISDEKFMTSAEKWLSDLKLRFSYGKSGNNRISDNAWRKTFYTRSGNAFLDGNETNRTTIMLPSTILSNPKLKWETTITRNSGLDFSLFKQRVSGSVEVYQNTTQDLLISATIPSSTGYSNQWQNIGQTSNKGLEFVLNANVVEKRDFRLSMSFNIGFNKNRIDKLGETKEWEQTSGWTYADGPTGDYLIKEGGQIGLMYGYETEGMYSFDDFTYANGVYTIKEGVSNNSAVTGALRFGPGSLKLKDQNGDFVVDNANDKVVIGNANPKHTGGFNLTAQYKGLDFSTFFNWVYGNNIYNANKLYFTAYNSSRTFKNLLNIMNSDNRFIYMDKQTGLEVTDPTALAEMNKNATIWSAEMKLTPLHSWAVEDGSFLRLNNATLGYSLPDNLLNKLRIQKFRIYFTAYNLWTWTKYSGYDPEVDTQRSTPLTPGVDFCAYPRSRSYNIGLNLEF